MEKKFFVLKNAKGEFDKFNYEFCNGKSAKIKIENKLNGMVWYFPTGRDGYNHLLNIISNSISMFTGRAEKVRDNISMYEKKGNRWVEIDNTNFYDNVKRDYDMIVE